MEIITRAPEYLRDVNQLLVAIGPILMFISPIFYLVVQIPAGFQIVFWFNPLTYTLETLRGILFFSTGPGWVAYGVFCGVSNLLLIAGFRVFRRVRWSFTDVI